MKNTALLLLACLAFTGCDDGTSPGPDTETLENHDDSNVEQPVSFAFDPDAVDAPTRRVAASVTAIRSADGNPIPEDVLAEVEDIQLRFAHALVVAKGAPYFAARSADAERIEVTYLGKGRVAPADFDFEAAFRAELEAHEKGTSATIPEKYRDDATWVTGFNPTTGSEFEVRIPRELSVLIDGHANAVRERNKNDDPAAEELVARHQIGDEDTRVRKGALDTAHTSTNLSRIVRFGSDQTSATGVLIGKNQVLTVAHRLYTSSGWSSPRRLRVGANGSGNHGDITLVVDDSNANAHWTADGHLLWISSLYKNAIDNGGDTTPYDIGTIVLPNDPLGESVGWFTIADPSNVSHDDMLNRGYANCEEASPPPSCSDQDNHFHMFGDNNQCGTGGFSSQKDAFGYSLYGYHSCDASSGHSGSPLYRFDPNDGWVVRGVHKGANRKKPNSNEEYSNAELLDLPNSRAALSFTLITQSRKNLFDLYNEMYTSP